MSRIILSILINSLFVGCGSLAKKKQKNKILFVVSNQHTNGNSGQNTANHFAEIVLASDVFEKAGYHIDFVSPEGGTIPIGYLKTSDTVQKKYLNDSDLMGLLKKTLEPADINPSEYVAVYYSGGAAMFGVPENGDIQNISRKIDDNNSLVSAICHDTAGIEHLKTSDGKYIYEDERVNGFPNKFENKTADYYKTFPFSIKEVIEKNGGNFIASEKSWDGFYQLDPRLIKGQNPSASALVAEQVLKVLRIKK